MQTLKKSTCSLRMHAQKKTKKADTEKATIGTRVYLLTHSRSCERVQLKRLSRPKGVFAVQEHSEVGLRLLERGGIAVPPGGLLEEVIDAWCHFLFACMQLCEEPKRGSLLCNFRMLAMLA